MRLYKSYIGIDIGKLTFVVAQHEHRATHEYSNDATGIRQFFKEFKKELAQGLCILETTGGYETRLLLSLCDQGFAVHRANTRKVKYFIHSYGNAAKTDILDAKALALYGYERGKQLELFVPQSKQALILYELVQRRNDLTQMKVAEKNRLQAPRASQVKMSCQKMIDVLTQEIKDITEEINNIMEADPALKERKALLKTIPGIGDATANGLLVLLPELGTLTRRKIASLAGLAPKANDSGLFKGYRRVGHGRCGIKPMLCMAAMAARNSNSHLKAFYLHLVEKGKKKMVALTALMRKLIVIANAKLRDWAKTQQPLSEPI
jgi:transposase